VVHMDVRRVWRSILNLAHARRDACSRSGRKADKSDRTLSENRELLSPEISMIDLTNQETLELYRRISFDKMPPL
jgi:hypothetical protein